MSKRKSASEAWEPKMLSLNIGENDPVGNQLVAMEMDEVAKMKFKKPSESRKKSINRIFGDMVRIDTKNEVSAEKARKHMGIPKPPRKSMLPGAADALILEPVGESGETVQVSMRTTARKMSFSPCAIGYGRSRAIKRMRGKGCRSDCTDDHASELDDSLFE